MWADLITWSNDGTDFNAGGSWVGGNAPGSGDVANFATAKVNDPVLTGLVAVQRLRLAPSADDYTLSSSDPENHKITVTSIGTGAGTGGCHRFTGGRPSPQ